MNLLKDPIFRIYTRRGLERASLPELLALLGQNEVESFVGLQRHQADAFHVFLSYLGAAALVRARTEDPVQDVHFWYRSLLGLSGGIGTEPWELVVDDFSKPAFMQAPLPPEDHGKLKPLEPLSVAVDSLDVLQTSKNHDVKRCRAALSTEPDEWVYALINVQTMSGYTGSGQRGISRMNSGYGNRSIVELVRTLKPGLRWYDAVKRLLIHRDTVLSGNYGFDPQGLVLVWLEPWDGNTSLPLTRLDPFYIEICRRIRLVRHNSSLQAVTIRADANRIAAEELKGVVGDPWLPIEVAKDKALSVSPHGLSVELLRRLIFADGLPQTTLQKPLQDWEGQVWFSVSVLVRGQGTTDGFHERLIPIPVSAQSRLFGPRPQAQRFASLGKTAVEYAEKMQSVLKTAIFTLLQGAPEQVKYDRDAQNAWWQRCINQFELLWSNDYFPWLWSVPEPFDDEVVLTDWAKRLRNHALTVLQTSFETFPSRQGRRYRARVGAERVFWRTLYSEKYFPSLRRDVDEHSNTSQ